jgi:hypothetical protein
MVNVVRTKVESDIPMLRGDSEPNHILNALYGLIPVLRKKNLTHRERPGEEISRKTRGRKTGELSQEIAEWTMFGVRRVPGRVFWTVPITRIKVLLEEEERLNSLLGKTQQSARPESGAKEMVPEVELTDDQVALMHAATLVRQEMEVMGKDFQARRLGLGFSILQVGMQLIGGRVPVSAQPCKVARTLATHSTASNPVLIELEKAGASKAAMRWGRDLVAYWRGKIPAETLISSTLGSHAHAIGEQMQERTIGHMDAALRGMGVKDEAVRRHVLHSSRVGSKFRYANSRSAFKPEEVKQMIDDIAKQSVRPDGSVSIDRRGLDGLRDRVRRYWDEMDERLMREFKQEMEGLVNQAQEYYRQRQLSTWVGDPLPWPGPSRGRIEEAYRLGIKTQEMLRTNQESP